MDFDTLGVLGAGVMGSGIAHNLSQKSVKVVLLDVSQEILRRAEEEIRKTIRFQGFFNREARADDPDEIISRISFTTDYARLKDVPYIIENVVEKWDIKKTVYALLDDLCRGDCIFASNTSAIPITRIASATKRPDRVIGIHFMNPAPLKHFVEVIPGYHTSSGTIKATQELLVHLGKKYIIINDSPGFVSNRVFMLTINEAVCLVFEQVAAPGDVDRIFKGCFEHKMGPLETADLIGLDTILYSLEVLYESFNDSKYRPCPLLKKMVDAGLYGRKSGKGFYEYGS
jgi:3-hydroxybutyryl-CoA dehydrogenase